MNEKPNNPNPCLGSFQIFLKRSFFPVKVLPHPLAYYASTVLPPRDFGLQCISSANHCWNCKVDATQICSQNKNSGPQISKCAQRESCKKVRRIATPQLSSLAHVTRVPPKKCWRSQSC